MEGIKKIMNIVVMVYLVSAALIYLDILNIGQHSNPGFYPTFFLVGGAIMLLELFIENLYILYIKRGFKSSEQKINELKAHLYDHKLEIQDLRKKQTAESILTRPTVIPPAAPINYGSSGDQFTHNPQPVKPVPITHTPLTAAPIGSDPLPPVANPNTTESNRPVVITPAQTASAPKTNNRFSDNSNSF